MKRFVKNKKIICLIFFSIFYFLSFTPVQAQTNELMTNLIQNTPVLPQADLIGIIFNIIKYVLMFVGVVAVLIIIYGGFLWMTARGNDEQVNKAKKVLVNGLIGLIVILLSYAIVSFAISKVNEIAQPPGGQTCQPNQCVVGCWRCNSQGNGTNYDASCPPCGDGQQFVVRWTWPHHQQENLTVCSLLQAGFNDQLDAASVNSQTVKITLRDALKIDGESCDENTECKSGKCQTTCQGDVVAGQFTVVNDVFKFKADQDFSKDTWYKFLITTGVRNVDGRNLNAQRNIEFKTGNQEDQTPPTVENVYPENNAEDVCLLEPIQSIFSEAMDVTTLVNIEALMTNPVHEFSRRALNEKTLEATPRNSYQSFRQYQETLNAGIITDVCGNKLDGDRDGVAEGSPIDDYLWSFTTGNTLRCQPVIDNISPASGFYNDELTINGNYFRLAGEAVFSRDVYPNNFCFNNNNFPNQACLISWTNQQIKIKIPAAGGSSQGTVSGPVKVIVGSTASNTKTFNLESPYLQSFAPVSGGQGQAITLRGINFGAIANKVYFISVSNPDRKFQGDLICAETGWRDYEIIVAVPQFIDLGNYYLQIERQDGKLSNVRLDETFEINNQQPGPTLCDIKEYCTGGQVRGGKPGDAKVLSGRLFGSVQGLVNFNSTPAQITSWADDKIDIVVPAIGSAAYQVKVVLPNFKESNPITFISPCFEKNGFGQECFLDENTCLLEKCLPEYECKSSASGQLECRCCCSVANDRCPSPLQCDETQPCYKSNETEITGVCCGCISNNQCQNNEICKSQGPNQPNCCFACQLGDEGQTCKGGECCSNDCANFKNSTDCGKQTSCSWNGLTCQGSYDPFCCLNGRCVNHQCLSLCGNGQIDGNEECDPGPPENLNNKTCELLGYQGGTLHCDGTCKFQVNDCQGAGGPGNWGEKCKNTEVSYCTSGRDDCSLATGARCVQNVTMPPAPHCACCCQPEDQANGITDSCKITNCVQYLNKDTCSANLSCFWDETVCKNKLSCSTEKACGDFGQKGLCCGCDVDAACGDFMVCHTDKCCYSLPAPTDLKFLDSNKDIINLSWKFSDANSLGINNFGIYKKDPGETNFSLLATCQIANLSCSPNTAELILQAAGSYNFKDKRGNFEKDKDYSYKIVAKKGITFSREAGPVTGRIKGTSSCQSNSDCQNPAPCCRTDNNVCVDYMNCQGNCQICSAFNETECTQNSLICQWSDSKCVNKNGNNCSAPAVKFAVHDFLVNNDKIGPCLLSIDPPVGDKDTNILFTGLRFGRTQGSSQATFAKNSGGRVNANYSNGYIWDDKRIVYAIAPLLTEDGEARVVVDNLESNGLWFNFNPEPPGPGDPCFYSGVCDLNPPDCSLGHSCLVDVNSCNCCCQPTNDPEKDICKNINSRLSCTPNQTPCTGDNRGLCCGCEADNQCGSFETIGCGMKGGKPWCCFPRPTWQDISFCDETAINEVKLNSSISLNFTQLMENESLRKDRNNNFETDTVQISYAGLCRDANEGVVRNNRCYILGSLVPAVVNNKTNVVFNPKNCQLKSATNYLIEIIVGQDGQGVRANNGTAINNSDISCSWNNSKKCQSKTFTTRNDSTGNDLCEVGWIDVQPRAVSIKDLNNHPTFQAIARDEKNQAVCVDQFNWRSSNTDIAPVTTPGLETIVSPQAIGSVTIIAELPTIPVTTCYTDPDPKKHSCGVLNISWQGPRVVEQNQCSDCEVGSPSPSPFKASVDACLAAKIVARFDKEIRQTTLNSNTIKVDACGTDLGVCDNPVSVDGQIETWEMGFSFKAIDNNNNPINLLSNQVYRVRLLSGANGIKDIHGLQLDSNGNGIQDGSPNDDYVWYFKTRNDTACPLYKVCLEPLTDKIVHPGTSNFYGRIYTQNCNYLESDDVDWQWSSLNPNIATVSPVSPGSTTTATSVSLGQTKIKALAEQKEAFASLIVATVPFVEENYPTVPNNTGVCLNTAIYAQFDQKMDANSFTNNFKIESEDAGGIGAPQKINETSNFTLRFVIKNNKTIVYFIPQTFLKSKTKYYLTVYGSTNIEGKNGVESIAPYSTKMITSKLWNFTTGDVYCQLEKVLVEPERHLFTRPKNTENFLAQAFYRNQEIQGIPDWYDWDWSWRSTDTAMATVNPSAGSQETMVTSGSKNGLASIIATATITKDEIFNPSSVGQFKNGAAQVEIYLCENPWPSTQFPPPEEGAETYQEGLTNFAFKYCRDAGAAGLVDDLPILKGGILNNPPPEESLGKIDEHFFTVYDGSLSFLYDNGPIIIEAKTGKKYITNKSGYNNPNPVGGTSGYNLFGNNNSLVVGSGVSIGTGKFGDGFVFSGVENSYLLITREENIPSGLNQTIETDRFTLESWIFNAGLDSTQSIFQKGQNRGDLEGDNGYGLEIRADNKIYFWVIDKNNNLTEISDNFIIPGQGGISPVPSWQHVAAAYDGKNLKLYINGILKQQTSARSNGISQSPTDLIIGRDFVGKLDDIAFWQKELTKDEIAQHLKATPAVTLGDVVGFKTFSNFSHLKAGEWYTKNFPGVPGSSSTPINGYESYKTGRTISVAATNVISTEPLFSPQIYTNIYLISKNDNTRVGTDAVFNKIVENWKFNVNLKDLTPETPGQEDQEKIIRDLKRIYDLKTVWQTLEKYKTVNKKEPNLYPRLIEAGGTWVIGMSTSKWPSWTTKTGLGQDLAKAGLSILPSDPINTFSLRDNCSQITNPYSCCADCPYNNPSCSQTCYNEKISKYEAFGSSHIYQYMSDGNPVGSDYGFFARFEYPNEDEAHPDFWQHQCEGLAEIVCRAEAFCRWGVENISYLYQPNKFIMAGETEPVACHTKKLNYGGNPCDRNKNECFSFNTRFFPNFNAIPPAMPEITNFSATPFQIYLKEGENSGFTTLAWKTKNAQNCVAEADPYTDQWNGPVAVGGTKKIELFRNPGGTTFKLTCTGLGGITDQIAYVGVVSIPTAVLNIQSQPIQTVEILGKPAGETNYNFTSPDDIQADLVIAAEQIIRDDVVYNFSGWTGCSSMSIDPKRCLVSVTNGEEKTVMANYGLAPENTLEVEIEGPVQNTTVNQISGQPADPPNFLGGQPYYKKTTQQEIKNVILEALLIDGYNVSWSGCDPYLIGPLLPTNRCYIKEIINGNTKKLTVTYTSVTIPDNTLEVYSTGWNSAIINQRLGWGTPSSGMDGVAPYTKKVSDKIEIILQATETYTEPLNNVTYTFQNWTGCDLNPGIILQPNECYIKIENGLTQRIYANYNNSIPLATLNVQSTGRSNVQITQEPGGNPASGMGGTTNYTKSLSQSISNVGLRAANITGYDFTGWDGCDSVSGGVCFININLGDSQTVIAKYVPITAPNNIIYVNSLDVSQVTITQISFPNSSPANGMGGVTNYTRSTSENINIILEAPIDHTSLSNDVYGWVRWLGCDVYPDASLPANQCYINLTGGGSQTVTAEYQEIIQTENVLNISSLPIKEVMINGQATDYSIRQIADIDITLDAPLIVTDLSGTTPTTYRFVGWSNGCNVVGPYPDFNQCRVIVQNGETKTLTAGYSPQ